MWKGDKPALYEGGSTDDQLSKLFMVKKICPADHFCRSKSDAPTPCAWGARCPKGTETPQRSPWTLIFLILVYVAAVLTYLGYTKLKQSQQKMYMDTYHSTLEIHKALEKQGSQILRKPSFPQRKPSLPSVPPSRQPSHPREAYLYPACISDTDNAEQLSDPTFLAHASQQTTAMEYAYGVAFGNRGSDEAQEDAAATALSSNAFEVAFGTGQALDVESVSVDMQSSSAAKSPDESKYAFLVKDSVLGQYLEGGVECATTEEPFPPFKFMGLTYKRSQIGFQFHNLDLKIKLAQTPKEMLSGQYREAQVARASRVWSGFTRFGGGRWGWGLTQVPTYHNTCRTSRMPKCIDISLRCCER